MKKLSLGLVIEGNSTNSSLLRFSGLVAELGPIKASSLQVARRVSNFLKAGYGVNEYLELASSRLILIRVPDEAIDRIVGDICVSGLVGQNHIFVLCESWLRTEKLDRLTELGSWVASVVALPTRHEKVFAIEGDPAAVRQVRRLMQLSDARSIELRAQTKHLLFAATALCNAVPVPLLLLAQQGLRDCGLSGNQLSAVVEELSMNMLSGFLKGSRMTWGGPLAEYLKASEGEYWDQLDASHPELAALLRELVRFSRSQMLPKLGRASGA